MEFRQKQAQRYYRESRFGALNHLSNNMDKSNRYLTNFDRNEQSNDSECIVFYNALNNDDKSKFKYYASEGRKLFKTKETATM